MNAMDGVELQPLSLALQIKMVQQTHPLHTCLNRQPCPKCSPSMLPTDKPPSSISSNNNKTLFLPKLMYKLSNRSLHLINNRSLWKNQQSKIIRNQSCNLMNHKELA